MLHPPLLAEVGIASAARWFVCGFAPHSGIHVNFAIADNLECPPCGCELVLFRLLQESLTNVHGRSGASTASVRLSCNTDHFTLEISDNGNGISRERLERFTHSAENAGVGSRACARLEELGGGLRIESDSTGTKRLSCQSYQSYPCQCQVPERFSFETRDS